MDGFEPEGRFTNSNPCSGENRAENKRPKVSARASGSPGVTNLWRGAGMLREVPGRLGSGSWGGCCRGRDETGAAGGFAGWRRGAREVLPEESRAGTGSEGGTAGGTAGIREG